VRTVFTRYFPFSASRRSGPKILGHNYVLGVTVRPLSEAAEAALDAAVEESLMKHLRSRDLTDGVAFLAGQPSDDASLLEAFWRRLEPALAPVELLGLTLQREGRLTALERP
jgi:hypothetical protein